MGLVTLPKTNQTGANEWADVEDNDQAIVDQVNGNLDADNLALAAVTSAKMANGSVQTGKLADEAVTTAKIADENVTGAKLSDDVVGAYRTVLHASGLLIAGAVASTYGIGGRTASGDPNTSGSAFTAQNASLAFPLIYLDDADYTIAGRTTKLRLRAQVSANATAPGTITLTFGLYPLTVAGAAGVLTHTLGTVVSGSTAAATNPSASTITSVVGSDFNVPADGAYGLAVVTSATVPANGLLGVNAHLQLRHV